MTVLWGEQTNSRSGTLKRYDITIQPEQITIPAIDLPTSKPADYQYTFTVSNLNKPIITPSPISFKQVGTMYVAGQNLSGGTATITLESYKNGQLITTTTNSNVANNYYWTANWCTQETANNNYIGVVIGDTISFKIWANVPGVKMDYYALILYASRIYTGHISVCDVSFTSNLFSNSGLSTRTPIANGWTGQYLIPVATDLSASVNNLNIGSIAITSLNNGQNYPFLKLNPIYGFGAMQIGDWQSGNLAISTSLTNKLTVTQQLYPTSISFREFLR